jgi:hypothetical protein
MIAFSVFKKLQQVSSGIVPESYAFGRLDPERRDWHRGEPGGA